MKRIIVAVLMIALIGSSAAFAQVKAKDGVYFKQAAEFESSGWKSQVIVEVKGGKIVRAQWNGTSNIAGATDKKSWAASGKYGMAKAAKQGEWDKQAAAVEAYLVKTQDVNFSKFDKEGRTDAISGATIHVSEFFAMVKEALETAPVPKGTFKKDGWFFAEQADFDANSGWKDSVLCTVVNGTLVDVLWSATSKDPAKKSKIVESKEGRYGMGKAAKKGEWDVQAVAMQDAIVKAGDPAKIPLKADGTTDAVSGASIHATAVVLATQALKAAR